MIIIGLTGGSGSGKSYVSHLLVQHGGKSVDADAVYHRLLEENSAMRRDIVKCFPEVEDCTGKINRRKLASIVFTNDKALMDLNAVTHPYVIAVIEAIIAEHYRCNIPFVIIDAIDLFESGVYDMCDVTIGVLACEDIRCSRIIARDEIDKERAIMRINAQPRDEYYIGKCDYIIDNNGGDDLIDKVEQVYSAIMEEME